MSKRTYSRRNMSMMPETQNDANRKRPKPNTHASTSISSQLSPTVNTKMPPKSSKHRGPVSIPADEMDLDDDSSQPNKLAGALNTMKNKSVMQPTNRSIYGSREGFDSYMQQHNSENKSTNGAANKSRLRKNSFDRMQDSTDDDRKQAGGGPSTIKSRNSQPIVTDDESLEVSQESAKVSKITYIPKTYKATKSVPPRRNVQGQRIAAESKEHELWNDNQENSRFLRLPKDVRNQIYDLAFGGDTIVINYTNYETVEDNEEVKIVPRFKYHCSVFDKLINPFRLGKLDFSRSVSRNFTQLAGVSRQIYHETKNFPYSFNQWAFESHFIMFNFLALEKRLSRAQRMQIRRILLPNQLPHENLLQHMPALEKVYVLQDIYSRGWYKVVGEGKNVKLVKDSSYRG
ncbi:hypothetical protein BDV95DRAFT_621823 [Massariosphaeria phaeospora]|uniref:DUF7730 domain-containing protein n=1 Tax=Massariosphaeria phaeospora TaxID=100035 RepID=A0A7C8I4D6_9PLEO|nr:hypothetical protein BDV95DRAFT_621823 [Massariosphaeria phaeospora]